MDLPPIPISDRFTFLSRISVTMKFKMIAVHLACRKHNPTTFALPLTSSDDMPVLGKEGKFKKGEDLNQ